MARRDLVEMYCAQAGDSPAGDKDFSESTQFPNLNSEDYRRKFSLTSKSQEFYENLICNAEKQVLVVTNDYRWVSTTSLVQPHPLIHSIYSLICSRRLWSGRFLLFADLSSFLEKQPALADHPCQSPISTVAFQSNDKVGGTEISFMNRQVIIPFPRRYSLEQQQVVWNCGSCSLRPRVKTWACTRWTRRVPI